jgi:hypothetical protein
VALGLKADELIEEESDASRDPSGVAA